MIWATTSSEHWTLVSLVLKHEMSKIVHHIHLASEGRPSASSFPQQPFSPWGRSLLQREVHSLGSLFFPFTNTSLSPTYHFFYLQSTAPALYINIFHLKGPESLLLSILIWVNIGNLRLSTCFTLGKEGKKQLLLQNLSDVWSSLLHTNLCDW